MTSGIIIVDKPAGMTSHGVVSRLRRIFGIRRIGHGGTLDPMATGVLPMLVGRATRASNTILDGEKTYLVRMRLGVRTDTQDITGQVIGTSPVLADEMAVRAVLPRFTGRIRQTPPMYSAIQKDGVRLYALARKGIEVEREAREITIHSIDLCACVDAAHEYELTVRCSKGTYIRTLCADIGDALGCGATVTVLRRTRTGPFDISDAYTLDALEQAAAQGGAQAMLQPVDTLFAHLGVLHVSADNTQRIRRGAPVYLPGRPGGEYRVYDDAGAFLGPGIVEETDRNPVLTLRIGFFEP